MIRIVAGSHKGRKLAAPDGQSTRPTSDRIRESMFNILAHGFFEDGFNGLRVLDAFAGTGALGLEALSRGADYALFMELDPDARGLIRQNVETLERTGHTKIFRRDATKPGQAGTMQPFNLVFLDPPYAKGLGEQAIVALRAGNWLTDDATIVLEEKSDATVTLPEGIRIVDERAYADTQVLFLSLG